MYKAHGEVLCRPFIRFKKAFHFGEKTKFNFFNVALIPNICLKFLNKKILTCERDNVLYGLKNNCSICEKDLKDIVGRRTNCAGCQSSNRIVNIYQFLNSDFSRVTLVPSSTFLSFTKHIPGPLLVYMHPIVKKWKKQKFFFFRRRRRNVWISNGRRRRIFKTKIKQECQSGLRDYAIVLHHFTTMIKFFECIQKNKNQPPLGFQFSFPHLQTINTWMMRCCLLLLPVGAIS